jgi:hypothetical protein
VLLIVVVYWLLMAARYSIAARLHFIIQNCLPACLPARPELFVASTLAAENKCDRCRKRCFIIEFSRVNVKEGGEF